MLEQIVILHTFQATDYCRRMFQGRYWLDGYKRTYARMSGKLKLPAHPIREAPASYQFTFIANWNCRGSYAAVGCPAFVNRGLTAATLNLLARLNMSAIKSRLIRSPK